jgi:hypothetical protein
MVSASENEQLGPFGMSFYNNLISLPMLVVLCLVTGEAARIPTIGLLDCYHSSVLAVSCILGFALSVTAFMLNMLISATAMMVANNVNKFAVIALSELLIQPTLSPLSTLGTVLVLVFGLVYAFSKQIMARFLG